MEKMKPGYLYQALQFYKIPVIYKEMSHDRERAVTLTIVTILWMLSLAMYCWAVYLLVGKVIKFGG